MKGYAIQLEPSSTPKVLQPVYAVHRGADGKIRQGLVVGSTQAQNEALILMSNPGEYKNAPKVGVALENALLSSTDDLLVYRHRTRKNYQQEGLEIEQMEMYNIRKVNIKAKYR